MKRFILVAIAFLFVSLEANSQSFTTRLSNGSQLCFQIADTTQREVEIVRIKALGNTQPSLPVGDLIIPSTVKFKDTNYNVISIGETAFAGAGGLNSVSIPSSVRRIGDRAFSGCSNLRSIVFPSRTPIFGEKVFEKCISLSYVSFGSDWKTVDLQLFTDAEALKEVFIPARVTKLIGVKNLINLEKIEVDPNNRSFSSHDGMLYSTDGLILYACPRAKRGEVSILDGTETILDRALSDCMYIESILLPASIHAFAYDEFSGCTGLNRIVMLSEVPPMTAKWNGATVFAIEAPNPKCTIRVSMEYLSRYQVSICFFEGVYETLSGTRKIEATSGKMIGKSSVKLDIKFS